MEDHRWKLCFIQCNLVFHDYLSENGKENVFDGKLALNDVSFNKNDFNLPVAVCSAVGRFYSRDNTKEGPGRGRRARKFQC
jgi:hypothetical protein